MQVLCEVAPSSLDQNPRGHGVIITDEAFKVQKEPAGQLWQLDAPGLEKRPGSQVRQVVGALAPIAVEYLPAPQGVHCPIDASPTEVPKRPAGQGKEEILPAGQ